MKAVVTADANSYRELLGLLFPVGEETAFLLVDLEIRHLETDRLVWIAREQKILHERTQTQNAA